MSKNVTCLLAESNYTSVTRWEKYNQLWVEIFSLFLYQVSATSHHSCSHHIPCPIWIIWSSTIFVCHLYSLNHHFKLFVFILGQRGFIFTTSSQSQGFCPHEFLVTVNMVSSSCSIKVANFSLDPNSYMCCPLVSSIPSIQ